MIDLIYDISSRYASQYLHIFRNNKIEIKVTGNVEQTTIYDIKLTNDLLNKLIVRLFRYLVKIVS